MQSRTNASGARLMFRSCSLAILLSTGMLTGCSSVNVEVPAQFPVPLVERHPLPIGLRLDPELVEYVHQEELESGGNWEIGLGRAQSELFGQLLIGMFTRVEVLNGSPEEMSAAAASLAGILVPRIEEVQFSTPAQTRTDYFEVWIRYQFQLLDREGTLLGEWPLTAYGKANQRHYGLQSREPALMAAALAACRDAMAFFTVQFKEVPPVRQWLAAELGGAAS